MTLHVGRGLGLIHQTNIFLILLDKILDTSIFPDLFLSLCVSVSLAAACSIFAGCCRPVVRT